MPDKRLFSDWVAEQRRGELDTELADALREVAEHVAIHGKAGTLTLTIGVKPASKGDLSAVVVLDDVKTKLPRGDRSEAVWFIDGEGDLRRHDPRQLRIDVREVPETPTEPREVPHDE